ncbi:MAG: hypothetical protein HUJ68_09965 [Clostridia bacterium]|nr:hypothetical protein [Clostridia bacterium]
MAYFLLGFLLGMFFVNSGKEKKTPNVIEVECTTANKELDSLKEFVKIDEKGQVVVKKYVFTPVDVTV